MENNANAMRDALKVTQAVIKNCLAILDKIPDSCGYGGFIEDVGDWLCDLRDEHVNPALAKPPRQCDIGTAEEQARRYQEFCDSQDCDCIDCPAQWRTSTRECPFVWAQMLYKESEAK